MKRGTLFHVMTFKGGGREEEMEKQWEKLAERDGVREREMRAREREKE